MQTQAETLTPQQRVVRYAETSGFPNALFVGEDGRIIGTWVMGNNYRVSTSYFGGYPPTYLRRIRSLFPEKRSCLHLFSGRVDRSDFPGVTVDLDPDLEPDIVDDAQTLENVPLGVFDIVLADPPYSVEDAEHYRPGMVKRNKVMRALGLGLPSGAHVVWLDQVLPMYRKDQFATEGYIGMVKSTNHRFRVVTIFRKL